MNGSQQLDERLRRLSWPVDRGEVWADIEARARNEERRSGEPRESATRAIERADLRKGSHASRRRSALRVAVSASIALVLVAAVAIGSLRAVGYLGKDQSVLVIGDQTPVGSTPGRVTQHPGQALATVGMGNGWWGPNGRMWAVRADRSLWARGYDPATPSTFARVGSDTDWVAADMNALHYLALKSDGSIWQWGETIGDNWTGFTSVFHPPTRVGVVSGLTALAAGGDKWLALKSDGSLWEWRLAQGSPVSESPARIGSDTDWVAVSAGGNQALALKSDGSLWGWSLAQGVPDGDSPTRVGSDTHWVAISAGASHSLALKSDGSLWQWGTIVGNPFSEGTVIADVPIRVGSGTNWVAISAGDTHSLALKSDGSLWAWGDNLLGRLGDGTSTTRSNPVRVGSDADWVAIAAGYSQSLAQKGDGSLWAWGEDLGRSPVKVLAAFAGP